MLIERWNPDSLLDVTRAGFCEIETFSLDVSVFYTHESWRGRVRSGGGVGASLSSDEVAALDGELVDLLERDFPAEPLLVTHRVFAVIAQASE